MRLDTRTIPGLFVAALLVVAYPSTVFAQGAVLGDDDEEPIDDEDPVDDPDPDSEPGSSLTDPEATRIGIGLRMRYVFIPNSIIEAFVDSAPGGNANMGLGLEIIRRKGNFEVSFGVEYESLSGKDGIWVDKDEPPPAFEVDNVEYDGLGWFGADVTFAWHTPLNKMVSLRYGAGIGLGVITGDVLRSDYVCTSADLNSCGQKPGGKIQEPDPDIPPVFPIVNILFGAQVTPTDDISINFEVGMRTAFYAGATVAYFF